MEVHAPHNRPYGLVLYSIKSTDKVMAARTFLAVIIALIILVFLFFGCTRQNPNLPQSMKCDKNVLTHCQNMPEGK